MFLVGEDTGHGESRRGHMLLAGDDTGHGEKDKIKIFFFACLPLLLFFRRRQFAARFGESRNVYFFILNSNRSFRNTLVNHSWKRRRRAGEKKIL
jgi:hypothetical protein